MAGKKSYYLDIFNTSIRSNVQSLRVVYIEPVMSEGRAVNTEVQKNHVN